LRHWINWVRLFLRILKAGSGRPFTDETYESKNSKVKSKKPVTND